MLITSSPFKKSAACPFPTRPFASAAHHSPTYQSETIASKTLNEKIINGTRLVNLCQQAFGSPANIYVPEAAFTLTREDIMSRIPEDMWYKY